MVRRLCISFLGFAAACLVPVLLSAQVPEPWDPIALTGHGAIFDREGREIELTETFLEETQALYLDRLREAADTDTREAVEDDLSRLMDAVEESGTTGRERRLFAFEARSHVIERLARQTDLDGFTIGHLFAVDDLMEQALFPDAPAPEMPDGLRRAIDDLTAITPPGGDAVLFSTFNQGQAYIDECEANGVPIPPGWNEPGWTSVGSLTDGQEFISVGREARVFKFESTAPEGTCIALPRVNSNGSSDQIGLLGIICLGKQTSKACFWDNQENDLSYDIGVGETVPLLEFAGGAELLDGQGGECTSCHAGENPFVIHPDTPLGKSILGSGGLDGVVLQADEWYDPLVHPNWAQNPGPSVQVPAISGIGSCTSCHSQTGGGGRFPQLSSQISGYCGTVLEQAVARTMPPGVGGTQQNAAHVEAMRTLCNSAAEPLLRIESEVLDFGEVEVGFAFTKGLVLHNDGNATLTVEVGLAPGANPADWDGEVNELSEVLIAPGDPPVVLQQVFEPASVGTQEIDLRVVSNDSGAPQTTVTLTGEGVTPQPIDSVLILDRSGSMADPAGDQTKIEAMRNAVMLYTDLMRDDVGDRIGFVRYNQANDVYFPLTTVTNGVKNAIELSQLSNAALNDLNRLKPDGQTGIGGAMLTAADEVGGPDPDRGSVMVVLTDGKENQTPDIADAIADISANAAHIQTYSVGLGFDIEPTKLQSITNMGEDGYHQVTNTLSDETLFDLEAFYFKIFASAANMDMVTDPTHVVDLGSGDPVIVDRARVISSDRNATFLVLDDPIMRTLYSLEFVAPDGQILSPGVNIGGIPIQERERRNYRIYRIVFPDPSMADTYVGDWLLRLMPNGKWSRDFGKSLQAESPYGYGGHLQPFEGDVPIGFAGAVSSDYSLAAQIGTTSFLPSATLRLEGALTDRGWPAPNGIVTVTITRPDGSVKTVTLHDDGGHDDGTAGDAVWANSFSQTAIPGVYRLLFRSVGRNGRGELAPRLVERYVTLQQPEPPLSDPHGGGGKPDDGDGGAGTGGGAAASYLIGHYDLSNDRRTDIAILNPTDKTVELVVSLFTEDGDPVQCMRDKLAANALKRLDIRRLEPRTEHGVIKVVSFEPGTKTPTLGITGNQRLFEDRGVAETQLHPIGPAILKGDLERILAACG